MTINQIDLANLRRDLEIAEAAALRMQQQIDRTIATYGSGVRPSWVSADLAIEGEERDMRMREAAAIRRQIEALEA